MEGYKSIQKGPDTMWKLNPSDRTIAITKLLIKHANLHTEIEIGA